MNAWRGSARLGKRLRAHDLEPQDWLVPDDPPVMSGRNLVDVSRAKLHLRAIVHTHTEPSGDQMTHVMRQAAVRARYGFDVLRPPPPRLELATGDGEITKPYDVERPMGKGARLVGSIDIFPLQCCHDPLSFPKTSIYGLPPESLLGAPLHLDVFPAHVAIDVLGH